MENAFLPFFMLYIVKIPGKLIASARSTGR